MTKVDSRLRESILVSTLSAIFGGAVSLAVAAQGTSGPVAKILYPAPDSVLPVAGYLHTYLAVETNEDCLCRSAERDMAFDAMAPFTNSNMGRYHAHYLKTELGQHYTFYVRCQNGSQNISSSVTVSFSTANAPSGVPANLVAMATSPTNVLLGWTSPDPKTTQFKIYRDDSLIAKQSADSIHYVDTNLQPGTSHRYAVSAVIGHEGPKSPEAITITLPAYVDDHPYPPAMLDSFEEGLRMINPASPPHTQNIWQDVCPPGACSQASIAVTTEDSHGGGASLKYELTDALAGNAPHGSSAYLRFRPETDIDYGRHNASEYITSGKWKFDTYNRMRFWVKVPPAFAKEFRAGWGRANMNVGTYIRSSHGRLRNSGAEESGIGGGHDYHGFKIPYTGAWHQIILDMHPSHSRGGPGWVEWGNTPHPTGENGFNYFDALTLFYVDFVGLAGGYHALSKYPAEFYFDDFEFYKDTNPENVDQVYSLNGVYVPADNRIYVGWSHPKYDEKTKYEVRYAFEDIYSLPNKWNSATPAPKGTVSPAGGAYNLIEYITTRIKVTGHDTIYIAIKPGNAALFREIALPVNLHSPAHSQKP
jgi:hypothetical protein